MLDSCVRRLVPIDEGDEVKSDIVDRLRSGTNGDYL